MRLPNSRAVKGFLGLVAALYGAATWVLLPRPAFSHETTTTTVLFDREIVRILNARCVMCHVENGPSFPLATYEQTWLLRRKIRSDVIARHMPPWAAVPGYGQFVNDNGLTLRETQFIVSWVEGLGPRNAGTVFLNVLDTEAARPKQVRAQANVGHWQLGEPAIMRQLAAQTIEPNEGGSVKRTLVDLGLTSERHVRALEYLPGDRRVVRAAFFTVRETGQWLGAWTPWHGFVEFPSGVTSRLPARAHIVAEVHYRGAKDRVIEQGTLGLLLADRPGIRTVSDLILESKGQIPPGTSALKFRAQRRIVADTYALSLRPEVLPGVTSIEVAATKPDGGTDVLLLAKDVTMEWPTPYIFKRPILLPRGTELSVTAYYANAASTPSPGGIRLVVSRY
jgi:hypothetical protein